MSLFRKQSNSQTWERVLQGDVSAYEDVVASHQSTVSAVAYSIVGDFPISQDIAQETFWVAWTKRNSLRDAGKLGSWLCGIARNLAKQWRRKQKKVAASATGDLAFEPEAAGLDPVQQSIADEEQRVVWSALEQVPEQYREVLALYYRQGQSIAEVATSLDISEDAARQRLSRGRKMLRGRVSQLIEGVLTNTKPDRSFVAKVMAGLAGAGVAAKAGTAAASSVAVGKTVGSAAGATAAKGVMAAGASTGAVGGVLGGLLGGIGGLAGGYFGTWLPAQFAQTETERQLLQRQGRVLLGLGIMFTVGTLLLTLALVLFKIPALFYLVSLVALILAFMVSLFVQMIRTNRLVAELRKNVNKNSDPNQSPIANYARQLGVNNPLGVGTIRKGRSYTSSFELFGYPLVDIQFSDADFGGNPIDKKQRKHARGWIALGDKATGILFAVGGIAKGFVACGGVAMGAVSFGGVSIGVLSLGGLAIGMWGFGGAAIGYDVMGGAAVGWHSAVGGLAVAWHLAFGGLAVAWDYAAGGGAFAAESNTLLAERMLEEHSFMPFMNWCIENPVGMTTMIAVPTVLVLLNAFVMLKFIYQKDDTDKPKPPGV